MKKLLIMSLAALGLAFLPARRADAWVNLKFSAGVNWQFQSGGNNWFWGAFRNGQPEGPGYGPGYGHAPSPVYIAPPPHGAPHHGAPHHAAPFHPPAPQPKEKEGDTAAPAAAQPQAYGTIPGYYGNTPYQATSYSPYQYNYNNAYYPQTGHYYPGYSGYYNVPSYWYGR